MSFFDKVKQLINSTPTKKEIDPSTLELEERFRYHLKRNKPKAFKQFLLSDFSTEEKTRLKKEVKRLYKFFEESDYVKVRGVRTWRSGWDELKFDAKEQMYWASLRFYDRRSMGWRNYLEQKSTIDFLSEFRPSWFAKYVNEQLIREWGGVSFQVAYDLYERGWIPKPEAESFVTAISNFGVDHKWEKANPNQSAIYNYLVKHPAIIAEDILLLFEYPHNAHNYDNYKDEKKQWKTTILRLVKEGRLDAATVAEKNLQALQLGFNRAQDSWQKKVYEGIISEHAVEQGLQTELLNLLNNANPQNVSFALKRLKAVQKAKQLDDTAFVETAPNLFYQESKTIVKTALQLLTNIAKSQPELRVLISQTAVEGLLNADSDIQKRSATLLLKYSGMEQAELTDLLLPYAEDLHSNTKELLKDYLPDIDSAGDLEEEQYDSGLSAYKLSDERAVSLVEDIDSLVFLGHKILETKEDTPIDLELFFDAFVRLSGQLTDPEQQLRSLKERTIKLANNWREISESALVLTVFFLLFFKEKLTEYSRFYHYKSFQTGIIQYLKGFRLQKEDINGKIFNPFIEKRLTDIIRLCREQAAPFLLSIPTHEPYWIHPVTLVDRIAELQSKGIAIRSNDLSLAMARIAFEPEQVSTALEKCDTLKGEIGDLMRFLLSGEMTPARIKNRSLWLNAARTRDPQADFSTWAKRWYLPSTPDLIKAVKYDSMIETTHSVYYNEKYTYHNFRFKKSLQLSSKHYPIDPEYLYVLAHGTFNQSLNSFYTYMPNNPEAVFANQYIDVEVFLEPTLTLLTAAHIKLTNYLIDDEKVKRQLAQEAFIIQSELGKIDYALMGGQLGKWTPSGYVKMNRLLEAFNFIAQTSTLHAKAIGQVIRYMLPHFGETLPRYSKKLFELWYDTLSKSKETVDLAALNPHSEAWRKKGSAKTILNKIAKLA